MIDKNDVKMPDPKKNEEIQSDEQIANVESLLMMVNTAVNKQELRLKQDYYSRFHWFGNTPGSSSKKSYFSYQEEAVYDFVFNLNKSGILSDQVGMGKTIEAGMIISELASRNELRSLLIIVPNEIMAQKWEYELQDKFGIRDYNRINANGEEEIFPVVKSIRSFDDFSRCIFDCISPEYFNEYNESMNENPSNPDAPKPAYSFIHKFKQDPQNPKTMAQVIEGFIQKDIAEVVKMMNIGLKSLNVKLKFENSAFSITGTNISLPYTYDKGGQIREFLKSRQNIKQFETIINNLLFAREYKKMLRQELDNLCIAIGRFFASKQEILEGVAESMTVKYPIMVIPKAYSDYSSGEMVLADFLNHVLLKEVRNFKHCYNVQNKEGTIDTVYEEYRVVDFFIDVAYQTLIVDEVHDYIDVFDKRKITTFHQQKGFTDFPSGEYDRYELFEDYYFIKKNCLYKKLKTLADKAVRKIFLTATPIKSDMVDFYLLTLLASNKDSEDYSRISEALRAGTGEFTDADALAATIENLYNSFKLCIETDNAPKHLCDHSDDFFREEERDIKGDLEDVNRIRRYIYPYFNNKYLFANTRSPKIISDYLKSHVTYMSMEEIILELILAYQAETRESGDVSTTFHKLNEMFVNGTDENLQTRVVFRTILNNTVKARFEEDFTNEEGVAIKRIRELLEIEDGPRKWHKTYRKYGIRHTRHQTYNLSDCDSLEKLNKNKIERFQNLPVWPRRNGQVIFLYRDDVFFDSFLDVHREVPKFKSKEIRMSDLPNIEKMTGTDAEKEERFHNAKAIFDYIDGSMSGGDPNTHLPFSSRFESVEITDSKMVEYKLSMVTNLMTGIDESLGKIKGKVLLFAEKDRDRILEWFRYQKCAPLYGGEDLDPKKMAEYEEKWKSYNMTAKATDWIVTESTDDLNLSDGNILVIIDPARYEKGVDLQKANTMINFDINYCPLKMEQRIGRIDRIRPSGQDQQINIISFVPLNNMSGFVINFFANELKMFTQWMGETTGIVSVPEEEEDKKDGKKHESVAFEDKVDRLEKFYQMVYSLCRKKLSNKEISDMEEDFNKFFGTNQFIIKSDFKFLQQFQTAFDTAFRNSMSPQREGFGVENQNMHVMRFNSSNGIFMKCSAPTCDKCPNKTNCSKVGGNCNNNSVTFAENVKKFCTDGKKFYEKEREDFRNFLQSIDIGQMGGSLPPIYADMQNRLEARLRAFAEADSVCTRMIRELSLDRRNAGCFTVPIEKFNQVFDPIKKLYWDDTVMNYIQLILDQFHKQCDSVLESAALFEKFIKTLAVADFMNNMEGNV